MNRKQTVPAFIAFFITIFILTMPLWADRALPYFRQYLRSAMDAAGEWVDVLKKLIQQLWSEACSVTFRENTGAAKY